MCCCDRILLAAYMAASNSIQADKLVCTCGCGNCSPPDPIAVARRRLWRINLRARMMLRLLLTVQRADTSTRQ